MALPNVPRRSVQPHLRVQILQAQNVPAVLVEGLLVLLLVHCCRPTEIRPTHTTLLVSLTHLFPSSSGRLCEARVEQTDPIMQAPLNVGYCIMYSSRTWGTESGAGVVSASSSASDQGLCCALGLQGGRLLTPARTIPTPPPPYPRAMAPEFRNDEHTRHTLQLIISIANNDLHDDDFHFLFSFASPFLHVDTSTPAYRNQSPSATQNERWTTIQSCLASRTASQHTYDSLGNQPTATRRPVSRLTRMTTTDPILLLF